MYISGPKKSCSYINWSN